MQNPGMNFVTQITFMMAAVSAWLPDAGDHASQFPKQHHKPTTPH
jgi:hypothetical protein